MSNLSNGLLFIAFFTGCGTFIMLIATLCAFDGRKDYKILYLTLTIIVSLMFLAFGFMGFVLQK